MSDNPDRRCEVYEGTHPPLLRFNCVHPYTAATTIDSLQLPALTVGEVIEGCWKTVGAKLEGVRLLGGSLFLSFKDRSSLESLVGLGLTLRGVHKIDLEDVSQGTLVLAMSGVPHTLQDSSLTKVLSQFGPIIGYIERRFYRNVDTGERLARIRLMSSLPKRIYVEGHEISIRSLPHDELAKLATLPSRIVRSTLQVSVNVARTSERSEATPSSATSLSYTSTPGTPAPSRSTTPFVFPTTPQPQQQAKDLTDGGSSPSVLRRGGDSETSGSTRRSRQRARRGHSPSSSSEQESPNKPPRRKMSIRRRDPLEDGILLERERSNSLSSRCSERRKLSVTGRESGKLPWFGCWGNGCI